MTPCHAKTNRPAALIRWRRNLFILIILMGNTQAPMQAQQPVHAATDLLKTDSAASVVMLPLKLLEFSGKSNKDIVQLVWTTAAETNINHYELEKSSNGIRFVFVNKQTGKGIAAGTAAYQAEDFKPSTGINYYRLKIVCNDGQTAYSKMILVKYKPQQ